MASLRNLAISPHPFVGATTWPKPYDIPPATLADYSNYFRSTDFADPLPRSRGGRRLGQSGPR
jgi:hypothetical protein